MSTQTERRQSLLPLIDGEQQPKYIRCYDNEGESIDRYTVVFTGRYRHKLNGDFMYLAMNAAPFHPQGFGQHGYSDSQIDRPAYSHLGKPIKYADLPEDCQKFVMQEYKELWDIEFDSMSLNEFKEEFRMVNTDTWGCAMEAWFEAAGHLHQRGVFLPEQWKYRAGCSPTEADTWWNPIFAYTDSESLMAIGKFLFRYCQYLKFKGIDY